MVDPGERFTARRGAPFVDHAFPAGYQRVRPGKWVRTPDRSPVPGVTEVRLGVAYPYGSARGVAPDGTPDCVCVPDRAVVAAPLMWVPSHALSSMRAGEKVWWVPGGVWDAAAETVVHMLCPELSPERLVGPAAAGTLAGGLTASTISAHLRRGTIPPPAAVVSGVPLWADLMILAWARVRRRPGQHQPAPGRTPRARRKPMGRALPAARPARSPRATTTPAETMTLEEIDAILGFDDADVGDGPAGEW